MLCLTFQSAGCSVKLERICRGVQLQAQHSYESPGKMRSMVKPKHTHPIITAGNLFLVIMNMTNDSIPGCVQWQFASDSPFHFEKKNKIVRTFTVLFQMIYACYFVYYQSSNLGMDSKTLGSAMGSLLVSLFPSVYIKIR